MYFESDCVECFVHLPWLCFAHYHKLSNSIYKVNVDTHGHLSQLRFQGMMTKILRNWKFSLSESFSGWYYGLRVFLTWFSSSETWKSLRSHSSRICSGSTVPCQRGLAKSQGSPRGACPQMGVCGTPLPSVHSIMSPYLQPAWEASSCFPMTPATDMCNWEQISAANAWLLKLTLGGRKHYISFWLPWLLLTAEVEEKPAVTPLQMLAP